MGFDYLRGNAIHLFAIANWIPGSVPEEVACMDAKVATKG